MPLISRTIDLDYKSSRCARVFNITTSPDIDSINKHGGFNFSYPRVAIIDGEADPWRSATPHRIGLEERESTISEPFILIKHGVHHWDENGVRPGKAERGLPPSQVVEVQEQEVSFVKAWLEEWAEMKREGDRDDLPGEL